MKEKRKMKKVKSNFALPIFMDRKFLILGNKKISSIENTRLILIPFEADVFIPLQTIIMGLN